jgi:hypothetical protein
MDLVVLLQNTR